MTILTMLVRRFYFDGQTMVTGAQLLFIHWKAFVCSPKANLNFKTKLAFSLRNVVPVSARLLRYPHVSPSPTQQLKEAPNRL